MHLMKDEPTQPLAADKLQAKNVDDKQWTYGRVPDLGPRLEGTARGSAQLAYARTLLAVVMEAACQLETVVENLEQMQQDQSADSSESQKAITVTTAQERDDGAETESHKRDP